MMMLNPHRVNLSINIQSVIYLFVNNWIVILHPVIKTMVIQNQGTKNAINAI